MGAMPNIVFQGAAEIFKDFVEPKGGRFDVGATPLTVVANVFEKFLGCTKRRRAWVAMTSSRNTWSTLRHLARLLRLFGRHALGGSTAGPKVLR